MIHEINTLCLRTKKSSFVLLSFKDTQAYEFTRTNTKSFHTCLCSLINVRRIVIYMYFFVVSNNEQKIKGNYQ